MTPKNRIARIATVVHGDPQTPLESAPFWQLPPPAHRSAAASKVLTPAELLATVHEHRAAGRSIVFVHGCFDLLHVGHVRCLEKAAELGDVVVVGVNSDASARWLKGRCRPVIGQRDRATVLAALVTVSHVVVLDEPMLLDLLHRLRPDVYVESGHKSVRATGLRGIVSAHGGRVHRLAKLPGVSTTRLVKHLLSWHMQS